MIYKISEFYSYLFQEEESITAAYFKTHSGTEYRVYFYPIAEYFELLERDIFLFQSGYFLGFTKLAPNENKIEPPDFRIRNTILVVVNEFFEEKGTDKVLIYYCDNGDRKNEKRSVCFDHWYKSSASKVRFKKYDEEIIVLGEKGNSIDYMSLILETENPNIGSILTEFQLLKERLISNK